MNNMKYLVQGMESTKKVNCLLKLTKIDSERKLRAIHLHLVTGASIGDAARTYDIPQPNLTECINKLNAVAVVCEEFHELKVYEIKY